MAKASATLRGRFKAGSTVRLIKVAGPHVLRPTEADDEVDTQTVDDDGTVKFSNGIETGARYFAVGQVDGHPLEVRLTGKDNEDDDAFAQPPILPEPRRLRNGLDPDVRPERRDVPGREVGPAPGLDQVPERRTSRRRTPLRIRSMMTLSSGPALRRALPRPSRMARHVRKTRRVSSGPTLRRVRRSRSLLVTRSRRSGTVSRRTRRQSMASR
jgi:hypothetical protein